MSNPPVWVLPTLTLSGSVCNTSRCGEHSVVTFFLCSVWGDHPGPLTALRAAPNQNGKPGKIFDMLVPHLPCTGITCPHSWSWLLRTVECSRTLDWISPSSHLRAFFTLSLEQLQELTVGKHYDLVSIHSSASSVHGLRLGSPNCIYDNGQCRTVSWDQGANWSVDFCKELRYRI